MSMNAAPEIAFSSEQGKANYVAARRQYPAQAIVNLKTMRDNMAHLVSVVGGPNSGTAVMGVVKADAYGHGHRRVRRLPAGYRFRGRRRAQTRQARSRAR